MLESHTWCRFVFLLYQWMIIVLPPSSASSPTCNGWCTSPTKWTKNIKLSVKLSENTKNYLFSVKPISIWHRLSSVHFTSTWWISIASKLFSVVVDCTNHTPIFHSFIVMTIPCIIKLFFGLRSISWYVQEKLTITWKLVCAVRSVDVMQMTRPPISKPNFISPCTHRC